MTIKRKLRKNKNGKKEYYLDNTIEYHSFQEIKNFCYQNMQHTFISDIVVYTFVVVDTDEEIDIICSWVKDSDDFYYVKLEVSI